MSSSRLAKLEKYLGWIAVPNIAVLFITLQALGFLLVASDPEWALHLALIPHMVMAGELWRLITFLSLPLSMSPIFVIFALWFLYFVFNMIENEWGPFKTTLYTLTSILVTIAFSFAFNYPVTNVRHFEGSLFLAAAALFPEMEVRLYFAIPVKIKWLAWLSAAFVLYEFAREDLYGRLFLVAIYSNFLIFFGPAVVDRFRQYMRRRNFRKGLGR